MADFAAKKDLSADQTFEEQVAHKHVPGRAYEVNDPVTKLIHTIGGGFFNEPKFYDSNRSFVEFYAELLATGKISSVIADETGLSEQAREIVETATAVANGPNPEDLLVIAAWARDTDNGLKLRATPQIMLAIAAAHPKTKEFVAKYATAIMRRADEIRQVFGAFRELFMRAKPAGKGVGNLLPERPEGCFAQKVPDPFSRQGAHARKHRGSLPHCLRKALALALASQSDFSLLKYNGSDRPTFADVLKMIGGSQKIGQFLQKATGQQRPHWPVSKAMFEYLVNGKYVEPLPGILEARRQFFEIKVPAAATLEMVKASGLTWENIVSQLGSTKEVWELCIPIMGEMALTRNLRNFEQAGISAAAWEQVYQRLMAVEDSVQLPVRFFAAEREVSSPEAKSLLAKLLDRAAGKVSDLPGVTMVLADNSGSAVGCAISKKSTLRVADCGNMLEAILAKKLGSRAIIGVFGDSMIWVPFAQNDTCLAIKNKLDAIAQREERKMYGAIGIPRYTSGPGVGSGTETGLWFGVDDLTRRKVHVDRMIFLSDLCCYTQGDDGTAKNCGVNMEEYFGKNATMQSMVDRYRQQVNPDCFVYSINLSGHGQSQLRPGGDRTHLLSGWSEKIIDLIRGLEVGATALPEQRIDLPTIEILRTRYLRL